MSRVKVFLLFIVSSVIWSESPVAQNLRIESPDGFLMERSEEVSLSRSAAPTEIGREATVMVMQRDGSFVEAERGSNGWVCATGRAWTGPTMIENGRRVYQERHVDLISRAPMCYNPLAAQTVFPYHEFMSRQFMSGRTATQVEDAVEQALQSRELRTPEYGSMVYMLSPRQNLNRMVGRWWPHFMFYTPNADAMELYGTEGLSTRQPFVTDPGTPWAVTTTVATHWSDGTMAPMN